MVGNPPFVGGQKLTGALGQDYREYLVNRIGGGKRGSADLCSYFLLRNLALAPRSRTGIIATNTIAQGDTREVGLDQATAQDWAVYRAVKSQPWSGTASVIVSLLWLAGKLGESETPMLDGNEVRGITPGLDPASRVSGTPYRLVANEAQSFQGSNVLGKGFVLLPEQARALITKDPKNADVLFPYLIGKDLNQEPEAKASRWVINFHDWSQDRAAEYADAFEIVEREVKPVRMQVTHSKHARENWWQYERIRPELYSAIADMKQVIVIALVSSTVMPLRVPANQVLAHKLCAFTTDSAAQVAILSSSFHTSWAWKYSATMKADLNYSPSDVYETFPRPKDTSELIVAGEALEKSQRTVTSARHIGLTPTYKLVHAETETAPDIEAIRQAHVEVDQAAAEAYGWTDLDLKHGFHSTPQGVRFTIAPDVQTEVLDRLLELNHVRYKEEVEKGLHTPEAKRRRAAARKAKAKARAAARNSSTATPEAFDDGTLFAQPDALF
ncbi:hypothetical protein GA0115245_13989 [Streptomyces sp. di188]|nr:hypothetical protein GA0115245_13989 [Streptomyces sp. di188]